MGSKVLTDEQYHDLELAIADDDFSCSQTARDLSISQPTVSKYALLYGRSSPMKDQDRLREIGQRICRSCEKIKDISSFGFMDRNKGYRNSLCRPCCARLMNDRRANPTLEHRLTMLLGQARRNATKKGRGFSLTGDYLRGLWNEQDGKCFYTGLPMSLHQNDGALVSIDRIDSSHGYDPNNVVLCCRVVNLMKWDRSYQELVLWCKRIVEHYG